MRFTIKLCLALCFCLGIVSSSFAQKKAKAPNFKEGIIKYEVEVEGMPEISQFVNTSVINLYMKEKNSKMAGFGWHQKSCLLGLSEFWEWLNP